MLKRREFIVGSTSTVFLPHVAFASETVAKGRFQNARKKVAGSYVIVTGPELKLVLSDDFRASNGPDVFIVLSRSAQGAVSKTSDQMLGPLKGNGRGQNFNLGMPPGALGRFSSVVVWCREFNVTFGFAPLKVNV